MPISDRGAEDLQKWFAAIVRRAGLMRNNRFLAKDEFKERGFLGSGGIARLRDLLWSSVTARRNIGNKSDEELAKLAADTRGKVVSELMNATANTQ